MTENICCWYFCQVSHIFVNHWKYNSEKELWPGLNFATCEVLYAGVVFAQGFTTGANQRLLYLGLCYAYSMLYLGL